MTWIAFRQESDVFAIIVWDTAEMITYDYRFSVMCSMKPETANLTRARPTPAGRFK
jgi:hypothetical protein